MFCKNCGAQLPDNVKFCNACGTQVTAPTQAAPAAPAAAPAAATTEAAYEAPAAPATPAAAPAAATAEAAYEAYAQQQAASAAPAQPTYTPPQEPQVRDYTNMTIDDVAAQQQAPTYDYTDAMPAAPKHENIALGLIGSIIGVLVGSVVYFLLGMANIVAGFSGIAMVGLGIFLYRKFSGADHSITGAIITAVLAAIAVFFAEWFVCGYICYQENLAPSFSEGLGRFFELVESNSELSDAFTHDLLMGYLFTLLGGASIIANEIRASKKSAM